MSVIASAPPAIRQPDLPRRRPDLPRRRPDRRPVA